MALEAHLSTGDTLTAAHWNGGVDYRNLTQTWPTYTVTWAGTGGTPTLGNGTKNGWYMQLGALVFYQIRIIYGTTTATTGISNFTFSLPVTAADAIIAPMSAYLYDSSATTRYVGVTEGNSTSAIQIGFDTAVLLGHTTPVAGGLATGDIIVAAGWYRAAV